ncbi:Mob1/phocein [Microdochium bolleyi]|uniref:Mob1/phocein n=1 Tax=Microdochium bolleyi TaxID=196109 RepID=A0A136J570_9PEZI|nr:Mob1/phocein [Microdochium bolleyi]
MSQAQSSPRLPSPPPAAEIQLGPPSPGPNSSTGAESREIPEAVAAANAKRRIHVGTKAEHMAAGPPLIPFSELESAFSSQEHLAALHYYHTASNTAPINRQTALALATPPPGVERTLWLYELCRFLIAQCNGLIVGFLFDTPPCSSATCPEMRASEWQFLCAVHEQPKSCCAIDYCCHTLDWAANVVTNPKIFPSRIVLGADSSERSSVLKNLVNVFRRLHRIFAHAWFQHRGVFWSVESQTGLYVFFKTVCDLFDLLPAENYKLPPEAEGLEPAVVEKEEKRPSVTVMSKPTTQPGDSGEEGGDDKHSFHARRSNTARHSSRPSVGSIVTTVIEEREDEQADVTSKFENLQISRPEMVDEGEETEVEVPVIVETSADDEDRNEPVEAESGDSNSQDKEETEDDNFPAVKIDVQEDVPVEPDTPTEEEDAASTAPTVIESEGAKADGEEEEEGEEGEEEDEEEEDEEEEDEPKADAGASSSSAKSAEDKLDKTKPTTAEEKKGTK